MARKNVKVDLPLRKVELEAPFSKVGILYNSPVPGRQHVLFVPENPSDNDALKYRVKGRIQSMADGTIEFTRERSHASKATRLATFDNGYLCKTSQDMYDFKVSVPCENKDKLAAIISDHAGKVLEIIKGGID